MFLTMLDRRTPSRIDMHQGTNGELDSVLKFLLIAAGDVDLCSVALECSGDDKAKARATCFGISCLVMTLGCSRTSNLQ